ncbi:MAG: gtfE [Cyanobacteria bacterium RYN_339]|nr:gtfE [Cyanobacteria bacterium RYN_339]
MRVLLSAVGTRGDVQPIVALAVRVRELGHEVRLCVPPNFVAWAEGFGFEAHPVGVEMRLPSPRAGDAPAVPLTPEQIQKLRESMPDLITDQFEKVGAAAIGCDRLLGANAHQYAARSIAERQGIPYVTALYAPVAIPSPELAPPPAPGEAWEPGANWERWEATFRAWNDRALERVNSNRQRLGLAPIDDVLRYNVTDHPWLAADATLGPAPAGLDVFETGAWILEDSEPLAREVTDFLEAGEPPIYVGFGSMPAPPGASRALIEAARSAGRRVIVSQGWADLGLVDAASDCLAVGDLNQQALFPRVAAVVHHGGAGTTAAAARAGVPQVVCPLFGDQFYWASRVRELGIGTSVVGTLTAEALALALDRAVTPRARSVARQLRSDGAMVAARRLVQAL